MSSSAAEEHAVRLGRRRPRGRTLLLVALAVLLVAAALIVPRLLPDPGDGPAVVGVTDVVLRDRAFTPPVIQVESGTTVTWTFDDDEEHNVVGPDWQSDLQASGEYQQTFTEPGSYRYRCTLHLGMTGRVDVAGRTNP